MLWLTQPVCCVLCQVTYGAVINACSYAQDIATAKRVMQEMRDDGIAPDAMEYSSLVSRSSMARVRRDNHILEW
jgi:pentatricopeptide repeat protein